MSGRAMAVTSTFLFAFIGGAHWAGRGGDIHVGMVFSAAAAVMGVLAVIGGRR